MEHQQRQFYSWDMATVMNFIKPVCHTLTKPLPTYGLSSPAPWPPAPHPFVKYGLLIETLEPTDTPNTFLRTREASPLAKDWLRKEFAILEQRYARSEGMFIRYKTHSGQFVMFDIGLDMMVEWPTIFGIHAEFPHDSDILSPKWRPWKNNTPFMDSLDDHYPWRDAFGRSRVGGDLEGWFMFAYCNQEEVDVATLFSYAQSVHSKVDIQSLLSMYEVPMPVQVEPVPA